MNFWKLLLANLIIFLLCILLVGIFLRQKILDAFTDKNYYIYVIYNRSEYPLVFANHKATKERRSFFDFLLRRKKASNNATGKFKYAKLHRSTIEDFDSTFISKLITAKEQARA